MSTPSLTPLDLLPAVGETTAGNYFVANYPPFSFWRTEAVGEAMAAMARPALPGTELGLYVHIPFCRKRCHFCYFKVYTDRNAAEIRRYTDGLAREMELLAAQPFLAGRPLDFVYFGGGTPSYLSPEQITSLVERLKAVLPWDQAREVAFECEPGTINERKLEALKALGVTRLSLGVENFKQEILEVNGRAHGAKEILRAYGQARSLGFDQINIDLIAGMVNETEDNWRDCIRRTIDLAPESVTLYQMEVPFNTTIYRQMKDRGQITAPVADWRTKRRWVGEGFAALEEAGYTVGSAYTAVRDPDRVKFLYRDCLWTGADLMGLGVASFSHVGGTHFQNHHQIEPYEEAIEAGGLPIHRALTMTHEERLIRELILQMKLGRVSRGYFVGKFGVDPVERYAAAVGLLREAGLLSIEQDELRLTREALLQVDRLLHEFFLPEHRSARYA